MENRIEEVEKPKETIAMQLILTPDGQLKVIGPFLNDKMACYGLLELAKDAIKDLHAPKIIKGNMLDFVRRK